MISVALEPHQQNDTGAQAIARFVPVDDPWAWVDDPTLNLWAHGKRITRRDLARWEKKYNKKPPDDDPRFQAHSHDRDLDKIRGNPDETGEYPPARNKQKSTYLEDVWIRMIDARMEFPTSIKLQAVGYAPTYHTPCFSGGGKASAKTRIAEDDFAPAERPSLTEWQFWEDRINESIARFQLQFPGEPKFIVRQDTSGNLVGQNLRTIRRTTQVQPQREQEKDAHFQEYKRRRNAGTATEVDEVIMTTHFGETLAAAGRKVGKSKEAMKKLRQRYLPKRKLKAGLLEAVGTLLDGERGWFLTVSLPRRRTYLYKLDALENATREQREDAIKRGRLDEAIRMFVAEVKRVGTNKCYGADGELTPEGKKIMYAIRDNVCKAFSEGHVIGSFDCAGPGICPTCSPAVVSPLAARLKEALPGVGNGKTSCYVFSGWYRIRPDSCPIGERRSRSRGIVQQDGTGVAPATRFGQRSESATGRRTVDATNILHGLDHGHVHIQVCLRTRLHRSMGRSPWREHRSLRTSSLE